MKANSKIEAVRNLFRVRRLRSRGCLVGNNASIGRNIRVTGPVTIGNKSTIQDCVVLNGQIKIGDNCRVEKMVEITGNVEVGDDSVIGAYSYLSTMPNGRLEIGNDVLVNAYSLIGASNHVKIGDHCIFAGYVHITDATHGIDNPDELIKHAPSSAAPISIADNVWLGSAVMVMMGSRIGAGSVIGAKSMVNSEIPAMSIAYGIPARVVRDRRVPKKSSK